MEDYYLDGTQEHEFNVVKGTKESEGSSRHTEHWSKVVQRKSDGKFFRIGWQDSVKDEMGWRECNEGKHEAVEVFPEVITTTIYK